MVRIQHVTITVPSEKLFDEVASFYQALGGIPLVRPPALVRDTPGRWLGFGDTQLHLILGDPVPSPAHFAIHLGDAYDSAMSKLKQREHPVRAARDLWGGRRSSVIDPAGNRLELFDRPPESVPEDTG